MTESDDDKTDEIREDVEDGDALGGSVDHDGGAILTLDNGPASTVDSDADGIEGIEDGDE